MIYSLFMLFALTGQSCSIVETVAVAHCCAIATGFRPRISSSVPGTILGAGAAQEGEFIKFLLWLFLADKFSCSHSASPNIGPPMKCPFWLNTPLRNCLMIGSVISLRRKCGKKICVSTGASLFSSCMAYILCRPS